MALIVLIIITIIVNLVLLAKFVAETTLQRGVAFFMVLLFCVSVSVSYFFNIEGFRLSLKPWLRERALKELKIELPTFDQYEEWFKPRKYDYEYGRDEHSLQMYNIIIYGEVSKHSGFDVRVNCYNTVEEAISSYKTSTMFTRDAKSKKISTDYEYTYSSTEQYLDNGVLWYYLPTRTYSTYFVIRYKKVVFMINEDSNRRKNQIDKAIDKLMASYEKYLEENELS